MYVSLRYLSWTNPRPTASRASGQRTMRGACGGERAMRGQVAAHCRGSDTSSSSSSSCSPFLSSCLLIQVSARGSALPSVAGSAEGTPGPAPFPTSF